eukprot:c20947_g1_i1 orf=21-1643(-)
MQRQAARKLLTNKSLTPSEAQKSLVQAWNKGDWIFNTTIVRGEKFNKLPKKWVPSHALSRTKATFQFRALTTRDRCLAGGCFVNFHTKLEFSTCAPHAAEPRGIIEVPLAQTGEGIADCELLSWLVNEGDEVDEFQPLCTVQSDKATIQITSRYKGRVTRLNFVPGDVIKVGEALLELMSGSSAHSSLREDTSDEENVLVTHKDSDSHVENSDRRALATPAVRQLARGFGIKLEDIIGSGKDGRVLKEDLMKHLEDKKCLNEEMAMVSKISPQVGLATFSHGDKKLGHPVEQGEQNVVPNMHQPVDEEDKIIHVRGYQRIMVKAMSAAAAIPHFYLVDELKLNALVKLKKNLQDSFMEQGVKLTYLPLMIKALSVALLKYPLMNSTCNDDASTICCKGIHNVGIAIATSHGLAVPNIKNVRRLSVIEIAKELSRLTQLATSNQLSADDVSGGTISVTNFGSIGGKQGFPLLNLPEVAIGAFGRIYKAPCFSEDGSVYPASLMNVTWAADHRVLDGATLANFSNEWKSLVEQPERLVLQLR